MNHLRSLEDFLRIKDQRGYGEDHTILHSDQGRVYASVKFEKMHQTYPITRSMSRAGTPTDNPVIESLIGWIKGDLKHYLKLHDFNDINKAIEIYVDYFNHHKVAYRLDYLTPVDSSRLLYLPLNQACSKYNLYKEGISKFIYDNIGLKYLEYYCD
jgi:transposase InsO family protein